MLSNPNTNLHRQQQQHRRQNSTPTGLEALKVPYIPASSSPRHAPHRRGQSLDQYRAPLQMQRPSIQEKKTVSSTNLGLQQYEQQILREAQQHRLYRPGIRQMRHGNNVIGSQPGVSPVLNESNNYWQSYNAILGGGNQGNDVGHIATTTSDGFGQINAYAMASNFDTSNPSEYFDCLGLGLDLDTSKNGTIEGFFGTTDGMSSSSDNAANNGQYPGIGPEIPRGRSITPLDRGIPTTLPTSPTTVHFPQGSQTGADQAAILNAFQNVGSGEETIKPAKSRIGQNRPISCMTPFDNSGMDRPAGLPSPPHTAPLQAANTFDLAPMPNPDFMKRSPAYLDVLESDATCDSPYYSLMSSALSPSMSSLQSSPELAHLAISEAGQRTGVSRQIQGTDFPQAANGLPYSHSSFQLGSNSSSSGHMGMVQSNSLTDVRIDATVEDTGITIDDIASFIEGPSPTDGKWLCLFPECNKRFGRKENIKSHVQTHLGDRQYRCNHCMKCFVRQHDLKRHAKIHSGVKPYPCLCGNSFARHDALTRHRQRGMCIGAFEGVVKKPVKRGRPRKTRPDADERQDKANRTRKRAIAKSYASSVSGSSESSIGQSPLAYDGDNSPSSSPIDTFSTSSSMPSGLYSDVVAFTPPTSPSAALEAYLSPAIKQGASSHASRDLGLSPGKPSITTNSEEVVTGPLDAPSPLKSMSSHYGTPPELSLSSSPPPSNFFDFEGAVESFNSGAKSEPSAGGPVDCMADLAMSDISEDVDQLFFDPFDSETGVDGLPSSPPLFLGKYDDDPFGSGEIFPSLSNNECDSLFGTP